MIVENILMLNKNLGNILLVLLEFEAILDVVNEAISAFLDERCCGDWLLEFG